MILNCPECGHKVSDKAPICPGCGIEIAGHVLICEKCGRTYFDTARACPHCHGANGEADSHRYATVSNPEPIPVVAAPVEKAEPLQAETVVTAVEEKPRREPERVAVVTATPLPPEDEDENAGEESHRGVFFISFIIAALILATMLYFYKDASDKQQAQQQADLALADSIESKEEKKADTVKYEPVVTEEIDTVKPQFVVADNEEKPVQTAEIADKKEKEAKVQADAVTISDGEKQKSFQSVRRFFIAINSKNEGALRASTTERLSSFRGKANASRMDVLTFMKDLYQADVTNLNWHLSPASSVKKVVTADGNTEYRITIPARRVIERGSVKSDRKFTVTATTTADGKVKAMDIGG